MKPAIVFFTFKTVDQILEAGGTQSWVLSRPRARQCEYAVLCRNARHRESLRSSEPHGSAFMIGRISEVVPGIWRKPKGPERSLVLFDEYALIAMPDVWEGRSPVRYKSLKDLGVDPATLDWKPMPERAKIDEPRPSGAENGVEHGMTIEDAKRGLAASFKVPPEAIEITIRM